MKIKSIVLASLLSALFVTSAVASELKVGYVNTQRIFRDAPAAQKAAKKLEGEFAKRDQDLQRMAKQLQGLQENLEKNSVTMAESERRTKEKEFGEISREFQRRQRQARVVVGDQMLVGIQPDPAMRHRALRPSGAGAAAIGYESAARVAGPPSPEKPVRPRPAATVARSPSTRQMRSP